MIRNFSITGLFGTKGRDYQIPFQRPYTILVGRNGSGKTTILNMLHAIASRQFHRLLQYTFDRIEVTINNARIAVVPVSSGLIVKREDVNIQHLLSKHIDNVPDDLDTVVDEILARQVGTRGWSSRLLARRALEVWQSLHHLSKYYIAIPRELREYRGRLTRSALGDWEVNDFEIPGEILYFPTYRRIEASLRELEYTVGREPWKRQADTLADHLRDASEEPGIVFGHSGDDVRAIVARELRALNRYERSRLNRLIEDYVLAQLDVNLELPVSPMKPSEVSDVKAALGVVLDRTGLMGRIDPERLEEYFARVREANEALARPTRLEAGSNVETLLTTVISLQQVKRLVSMYQKAAKAIEKRAAVLERMKTALEGFLEKELVLTEEQVGATEADGTVVDFENLSSGEKQLIALFVYTRLNARKDTAILIDEPELSLHIDWQRKLLPALADKDSGAQFIIATHSPFVLGPAPRSVVALGESGDGI